MNDNLNNNLDNNLNNTQNLNPNVTGVLAQHAGENAEEVDSMRKVYEKDYKVRNVRKVIVRIFEIIIIILFAIWAYILYCDYDNVKQSKKPKYCFFGNKLEKEKLGTIETYTCLGYKVVTYKTKDAKMTEFVPIWQSNRDLKDINK